MTLIESEAISLELTDPIQAIRVDSIDADNPDDEGFIGTITHPYVSPPYPNHRAHHLHNYWLLEGNYIPLMRFYFEGRIEGPVVLADSIRERLTRQLQHKTGEYHHEYIGTEIDGIAKFVKSNAGQHISLHEADFDDLLCISVLPDDICFGCQSTGEGHTGSHCERILRRDYEDLQRIITILDELGVDDAYVPYLIDKNDNVIGIITSKRNLYVYAGRKISMYEDIEARLQNLSQEPGKSHLS